jgi:hypothetical protein
MAIFKNNPPIVTNGLVLALDAANRQSYVSGSTTWNDLSGNNNSGSLVNGPTFDSANGGSIVFDGSNVSKNWLSFASTPETRLNGPNYTIECWVKIDATNTVNDNFVYYVNSNVYGYQQPSIGIYVSPKPSIQRIGIVKTTASGTEQIHYYTSIPNNTWIYGTWVVTNTNSVAIYLNTKYLGTLSIVNYPIITATDKIWAFGNWGTGNPSDWVLGNYALLKLYNRALTAEEILQNYNATKTRFGLT